MMLSNLFKVDYATLEPVRLWEHYEACLKAHDWSYQYSDDSRYWTIGTVESKYIEQLKEKLLKIDVERTMALYKQYCVE